MRTGRRDFLRPETIVVSIAKSVGVLDLVELERAVDRLLDVSGALDRVAVGVEADGAGDRVDGQAIYMSVITESMSVVSETFTAI